MKRRFVREGGFAALEGAIWLMALLPAVLVSGSLLGTVHDQNVLQNIPDAVLRETYTDGVRWTTGRGGDSYEVSRDYMRRVAASVSQAAMREAERSVFKVGNISAQACFWIFSVNPSNGRLNLPISTECEFQGPIGRSLSLQRYLDRERVVGRGVDVSDSPDAPRFAERVALVGLVVGGEFARIGLEAPLQRMEFGAVIVARQEITL